MDIAFAQIPIFKQAPLFMGVLIPARCKLIPWMRFSIVVPFYGRIGFKQTLYISRFKGPALSRYLGNKFMVVLCTPFFDPVCERRSVKHKRIHWARDLAVHLDNLLSAHFSWPIDPFAHVSNRGIHAFCYLAKRGHIV